MIFKTTYYFFVKIQQTMNQVVFHIISIICCLLSLCIPLIPEIIPCFIILAFWEELTKPLDDPSAVCWLVLDYLITILVLLIWGTIILFIVISTFGVMYCLLFFLIPYFVVLVGIKYPLWARRRFIQGGGTTTIVTQPNSTTVVTSA